MKKTTGLENQFI